MRISYWSSDVCSSDLDDALGVLQFIGIVDDNRVYAQALKRVAHGPEVGAAGIDHRHPLRRPAHSTPLVLGSPPPSRRIASPSARTTALTTDSTWCTSFAPCPRRCRVIPPASPGHRQTCGTSSVGRSPTRSTHRKQE